MATRELSLFADLDQGRLVQGFLSTLQATLPRFVFGDSIPVSFRPLKSNGNNSVNPWSEVDLTGKTVRIAIGNPAGAASSGTFTLSYGGNTTAAIAYNADGAAIQTALNALASITAAGGVVVTRATTGAFRIVFNTAGTRTAITADAAAIYPSAGVEIHVSVEGDGSTREIVVARLEVLPAAYAELSDDFPVAASEIVEVRTGSGSVGAILSFCFSVLPYSGFYTLEIGGEQTLGIPWDADASTLQAALELLSTVGAGKVIVSGDWPSFTLNFDISLGDIGAMTIDMTGLVVPKGRAGILNTNTAAMIELLNGASQATAKLEVELYDIADTTTWTVLQTDCTVIDDVIGNDPAIAPPFPSTLVFFVDLLKVEGDGLGIHELTLNSSGGTSGILNLYSDSGFKATIYAPIAYTGNRTIELPDADGTVFLGMKYLDARTSAVVVGPNDNGVSFQLSSAVGTLTLPDPTPGMRFWAFVTSGVVTLAGSTVTDFRRSATVTTISRNDGIVEFEACGYDFWKFIPEVPRAFVKTVATLPDPIEAGAGRQMYVTDSNQAPSNVGSTSFTGGGANFCPVYSNGTQWVIG